MRSLIVSILIIANLFALQPHFIPYTDGERIAVTFPGDFVIFRSSVNAGNTNIEWMGESGESNVRFTHKTPARIHVFKGQSSGKHFETYSQIVFENVYPGIHRILTATENGINISWIVEPGADPAAIRFKIHSPSISHSDTGINFQRFSLTGIRAYQGAEEVDIRPVVKNGTVSWKVGEYDRKRVLVIDPDLTDLRFSTYLGGGGSDGGSDIVVANNSVYIVGDTDTSDFPITQGSYDNTFNGEIDVFVARFSLDLRTLIAATFIGGDSWDYGVSIDVNSQGNIVIGGETYSMNFPIQNGAFRTYVDSGDAYVAILSSDLSSLIASSYFGGVGLDRVNDLLIYDDTVYICGLTYSPDMPTVGGGYQGIYRGSGDGFVAAFTPNLNDIVATTYLGGDRRDELTGIVKDTFSMSVYVTGYSLSSNMPITPGAYDSTNSSHDAYVGELSKDLTTLISSTFIGSQGAMANPPTEARTICQIRSYSHYPPVDVIVIGGFTNAVDFPLVNAFDTLMSGYQEGFLAVFTPGLDSLIASTYVGGYGMSDVVNDIKQALSSIPAMVVVGETDSGGLRGATGVTPYDSSFNGSLDAFLYVIEWDLDSILGFTYYGGSSYDEAKRVFVKDTIIYIVGGTESSDLPVSGGYDNTYNGVKDAYVAAFDHEVPQSTPIYEKQVEKQSVLLIGTRWLEFEVKRTSYVGFSIFDVTGRKVFERSLGVLPSGTHRIDLKGMRAGINFLTIRIGDDVETVKVVRY